MTRDNTLRGRLLSIQSHVVCGHVGGQAGALPLALLGWDVASIPTVLFSNHPAYGSFQGQRTEPALLESLLNGLDQNGLARFDRLLTGYIPSPEAAQIVALYVERLRAANTDLVYIFDPVLGESARGFYVDQKLAPLYRQLSGAATIITPNHFEAEVLSGLKINDAVSLKEVLKVLHNGLGVPHVLITSVELPSRTIAPLAPETEQPLQTLIGSSCIQGTSKPWYIQAPVVPGHYSGTGDLLAALVAGKFNPNADAERELQKATEYAVSSLHQVLVTTYEHVQAQGTASAGAGPIQVASLFNPEPTTLTSRSAQAARTELRIVESRESFDPLAQPKFTAAPL